MMTKMATDSRADNGAKEVGCDLDSDHETRKSNDLSEKYGLSTPGYAQCHPPLFNSCLGRGVLNLESCDNMLKGAVLFFLNKTWRQHNHLMKDKKYTTLSGYLWYKEETCKSAPALPEH